MSTPSLPRPVAPVVLHRLNWAVSPADARKAVEKNGNNELLFFANDGRIYALQSREPTLGFGDSGLPKVGDAIEVGTLKGEVMGIDIERSHGGVSVGTLVVGGLLFASSAFVGVPGWVFGSGSLSTAMIGMITGLATMLGGTKSIDKREDRRDADPLPALADKTVVLGPGNQPVGGKVNPFA